MSNKTFKLNSSFKGIIMNLLIKFLRLFPLNWLNDLDTAVKVAFHGKRLKKDSFMVYTEVESDD